MSQMFDKRFVHFMWDDALKGKEGFFADSIDDLIVHVNKNTYNKDELIGSDGYYHFVSRNDEIWTFFYHDPLYEYRWAHEHGKKVQVNLPLSGWSDMLKDWTWDYSMEYRIVDVEDRADWIEKIEKIHRQERLTHKQFAMWLAKGNGQAMGEASNCVYTDNYYNPDYEDDIIPDHWRVRRWDDTEWHEPTIEYCFPEVRAC